MSNVGDNDSFLRIQWEWRDICVWVPYDAKTASKLEAGLGYGQPVEISTNGTKYSIDLKTMRQTEVGKANTQSVRRLRLLDVGQITRWTKLDVKSLGPGARCGICKLPFLDIPSVRLSKCQGHAFHKRCIEDRFQYDQRCPECEHDYCPPKLLKEMLCAAMYSELAQLVKTLEQTHNDLESSSQFLQPGWMMLIDPETPPQEEGDEEVLLSTHGQLETIQQTIQSTRREIERKRRVIECLEKHRIQGGRGLQKLLESLASSDGGNVLIGQGRPAADGKRIRGNIDIDYKSFNSAGTSTAAAAGSLSKRAQQSGSRAVSPLLMMLAAGTGHIVLDFIPSYQLCTGVGLTCKEFFQAANSKRQWMPRVISRWPFVDAAFVERCPFGMGIIPSRWKATFFHLDSQVSGIVARFIDDQSTMIRQMKAERTVQEKLLKQKLRRRRSGRNGARAARRARLKVAHSDANQATTESKEEDGDDSKRASGSSAPAEESKDDR